MNLVVALTADVPANNKMVATLVVATARSAKCMMLFAQLAVKILKYLSVQAAIVPYIAVIASIKTNVTKVLNAPALQERLVFFYVTGFFTINFFFSFFPSFLIWHSRTRAARLVLYSS